MSAARQIFLHWTFSCPALREAVVSPNLFSVLLEEEEEKEEKEEEGQQERERERARERESKRERTRARAREREVRADKEAPVPLSLPCRTQTTMIFRPRLLLLLQRVISSWALVP